MAWDNTNGNQFKKIYHGDMSNLEILEHFIKWNGFNKMQRYDNHTSVSVTLKTGRNISSHLLHKPVVQPPYVDHATYFKNTETGECCLTYNPYDEADIIRDEIIEWAKSEDLKVNIYDSSKSWYAPNMTCFVVVSLPNVIIKMDESPKSDIQKEIEKEISNNIFLGKWMTEMRGSYQLDYKAEIKNDEIIISAKMKINKDKKSSLNLIKKANLKKTSPLTLVLKEKEKEKISEIEEDKRR